MLKLQTKDCTKCPLHEFAKTNCHPGKGSLNPKLLIRLDYPYIDDDRSGIIGNSQATKLLLWLLKRMSLTLDEIAIDFVLKCHKPKNQLKKKPDRLNAINQCRSNDSFKQFFVKAIVLMGSIACESRFKEQLKDKESAFWQDNPRIFVTYSPAYAIETPSETVGIYRMIWWAAEHAGLKPKFNPNIKPFNYDI